MRHCLPVVFFFAQALVAQGFPGKNSNPEDAVPKGSVSGTVVDSLSGAPIRKARISLSGSSYATAITDAAGAFSFEQVPAGNLVLSAEHSDYPRRSMTLRYETRVALAPGERKRGVELRMIPGASLGGRIMDPDGDPVASCSIGVMSDPSRPAVIASVLTDKNGEYVVERLPAGRYAVQAQCGAPNLQPRPFAPPDAILPGRQLAYGRRYYPDVPDGAAAQRVPLAAGQSLKTVDFHMSIEPVSSLAVRVSGISLRDTQGIQGTLTTAHAGPTIGTSTQRQSYGESYVARWQPQQNGQMVFTGIRPGSYVLRVLTSGTEPVLLAKQPVEITEESKTVTVNAILPAPLSGTVVASPEKEDVVQPRSNRRSGEGAQGRVYLTDSETNLTSTTDIKPDGTFSFRGVSPGRYRVTVMARQQSVQSVALDGVTSDDQEIEVKPGGGGTLEIHTGRETGTVSGDLQDIPANVSKIHIFLTSLGVSNTVTPHDYGEFPAQPAHYSLPIQPGRYRLYATTLGAGEDISSIIGSENLASRGEEINVRPGKELVRNIKVITAEDVQKETP